VVVRQSRIAYTPHDAETTEHFHRASRDVIALDTRQFTAMALFDDDHFDAAPRKIHRHGRADRTTAYYQDTR
jgi:hypothetical protein